MQEYVCVCIQLFSFLTENFYTSLLTFYRSWPQMRTQESSFAFWSEFLCFLLYNSMPSQNLKVPISTNRKRHLLTLTFCAALIYKNVHLEQNVLAVLVFLLGFGVSCSKVKRKKGFLNSDCVWFLLRVLDTMSPLKYYLQYFKLLFFSRHSLGRNKRRRKSIK